MVGLLLPCNVIVYENDDKTATVAFLSPKAQFSLCGRTDIASLTPDLVFRDPYLLDFLGLADTYSEKDLEDAILREMGRQGIQVSNYFPPVHFQPFIAECYGHRPGDFPLAESASRRTIALPFHNHLTEQDVALVCGARRADDRNRAGIEDGL